MSYVPDHIENPDAWLRGRDAAIKRNAFKGKRARFKEAEPELFAQLDEIFYPRWVDNEIGWQRDGSHYDLKLFTFKQQSALARKLSWLQQGYEEYGSLTEKQAAKAKEIIEETVANIKKYEDEDARRRAAAEPWEAGRQEFPCTVVSLQLKDVPKYSYYGSGRAWKMIVQTESGARLYCTAPSRLVDEAYRRAQTELHDAEIERAARGIELVLRVAVTPADDDPSFAFGKRPHIVNITDEEESDDED